MIRRPPRSTLSSSSAASDVYKRQISQIIEGTRCQSGEMTSGFRAGRRNGWGPLASGAYVAYQTVFDGPKGKELTAGKVLINERPEQKVILQPHEGIWQGLKVAHKPCYQTPHGYTLTPNHDVARERVGYEALVSQVELRAGGELVHSSARRLSDSCLLYTSPSPRDGLLSRMPSSA